MKDRDQWMRLCVQAAIEDNLDNFIFVEKEIEQLLKAKEQRLSQRLRSEGPSSSS